MRSFFVFFFGLYFFAAGAQVPSARLQGNGSTVTYHMSHPLHNWSGTSKKVNGVVQWATNGNELQKIALVIPISSFDSKNSNRDAHMLEVTEALRYPTVTFVSTQIIDRGNDELTAKGLLTFHGKTKEVQISGTKKGNRPRFTLTGSFAILLSEYGVDRPSLMLMKTEDEVRFDFSLVFAE